METLAGRVVIGQNIRFDLAVLRHEAARAGVPWRDSPVLDVAHLTGALDRGLVDLGLESLANRFGVTIEARHDALGDSLAAAGIFTALVPRLRARGRTYPRRGGSVRRAPRGPCPPRSGGGLVFDAGRDARRAIAAAARPRRQLPLSAQAGRCDELSCTVDPAARHASRGRQIHDRAADWRAPRHRRRAASRRHRHRARPAASHDGSSHRPRCDAGPSRCCVLRSRGEVSGSSALRSTDKASGR